MNYKSMKQKFEFGEAPFRNLRHTVAALMLVSGTQFMASDALAKDSYVAPATAAGVPVTGLLGCTTCHTAEVGNSGNVKSDSCTNAFRNNGSYSALATCLKGGTTPTTAPTTPPTTPPTTRPTTPPTMAPTTPPTTPPTMAPTTPPTTPPTSGAWSRKSGSLGSGASRSDVYQVRCPVDTRGLFAFISDEAPVMPPVVNVQIQKNGLSSGLIADPIDADGIWSLQARLNKNAGRYTLTVSKTASTTACISDDGSSDDEHEDDSSCKATAEGKENYIVRFACKAESGAILPNTFSQTQNQ